MKKATVVLLVVVVIVVACAALMNAIPVQHNSVFRSIDGNALSEIVGGAGKACNTKRCTLGDTCDHQPCNKYGEACTNCSSEGYEHGCIKNDYPNKTCTPTTETGCGYKATGGTCTGTGWAGNDDPTEGNHCEGGTPSGDYCTERNCTST